MNLAFIRKKDLITKYSSIFSDNTNVFLVSKLSNTVDKYNQNLEHLERFEFKYNYLDICYGSTSNLFYGLKTDDEFKSTIIEIIDTNFKIINSRNLNLNTVPTEITFDNNTKLLHLKVEGRVLTLDLKTFKLVNSLALSEFKKTTYFDNVEEYESWLKINKINTPRDNRVMDITNINNYIYILERANTKDNVFSTISVMELVTKNHSTLNFTNIEKVETVNSHVSKIEPFANSIQSSETGNLEKTKITYKDEVKFENEFDVGHDNEYYDFSDFSNNDLGELNFECNDFYNDVIDSFDDGFDGDLNHKNNDIFANHEFANFGLGNIINHKNEFGSESDNTFKDHNYHTHLDNNKDDCHKCDDKPYHDDCHKYDDKPYHDDCHKYDDKPYRDDCHKCDDKPYHDDCHKCDDKHHDDCHKCDDKHHDDCHKCDDKHHEIKCKENCDEILHSIANVELAIAHILHSEGCKIQKVVKCSDSICEILEVNNSVIEVIERVTKLEDALCCKLKALKDVCPEKHKCDNKHCFDKFS